MINLINANAKLIPLQNNSVHCVITSPPYWGLRKYDASDDQLGNEGLHDCLAWTRKERILPVDGLFDALHLLWIRRVSNAEKNKRLQAIFDRTTENPEEPCGKCFVCNLRIVAKEIWRVLRPDGTFFLNLGDSYNGSGGTGGDYNKGGLREGQPRYRGRNISSLKPKDLSGIPWRVALALQTDGWWLRNDNIWHKPNAYPEGGARDRFGRDHEYIFLFSKARQYFFDQEAGRIPYDKDDTRWGGDDMQSNSEWDKDSGQESHRSRKNRPNLAGKNPRTTWVMNTVSSGAKHHFATFPPSLPEKCIRVGTSEFGVCEECGAPYKRVVERKFTGEYNKKEALKQQKRVETQSGGVDKVTLGRTKHVSRKTTGWEKTCEHYSGVVPATVLDPFAGSGTTGLVARKLGRDFIGLDLSYSYLHKDASERLGLDLKREFGKPKKVKDDWQSLPLFNGVQDG